MYRSSGISSGLFNNCLKWVDLKFTRRVFGNLLTQGGTLGWEDEEEDVVDADD